MKKFLSVFLSILILSAVFAPAAAAAEHCGNSPIVYIYGDTEIRYRDENGQVHECYDDGEYVSEILSNCVPDLLKGIATGNYDDYCEKVLDIILPAYEHYAPDLEGNLPEGSFIDFSWSPATVSRINHATGKVVQDGGLVYGYRMDKRLSPLDTADDLHNYIEEIKRQTGHTKVSVVARCLGPVALYAYLQKYERANNYSGIDQVVIVGTTANGISYGEAFYSGKVVFDPEAVNYYLAGYYTPEDMIQDGDLAQ